MATFSQISRCLSYHAPICRTHRLFHCTSRRWKEIYSNLAYWHPPQVQSVPRKIHFKLSDMRQYGVFSAQNNVDMLRKRISFSGTQSDSLNKAQNVVPVGILIPESKDENQLKIVIVPMDLASKDVEGLRNMLEALNQLRKHSKEIDSFTNSMIADLREERLAEENQAAEVVPEVDQKVEFFEGYVQGIEVGAKDETVSTDAIATEATQSEARETRNVAAAATAESNANVDLSSNAASTSSDSVEAMDIIETTAISTATADAGIAPEADVSPMIPSVPYQPSIPSTPVQTPVMPNPSPVTMPNTAPNVPPLGDPKESQISANAAKPQNEDTAIEEQISRITMEVPEQLGRRLNDMAIASMHLSFEMDMTNVRDAILDGKQRNAAEPSVNKDAMVYLETKVEADPDNVALHTVPLHFNALIRGMLKIDADKLDRNHLSDENLPEYNDMVTSIAASICSEALLHGFGADGMQQQQQQQQLNAGDYSGSTGESTTAVSSSMKGTSNNPVTQLQNTVTMSAAAQPQPQIEEQNIVTPQLRDGYKIPVIEKKKKCPGKCPLIDDPCKEDPCKHPDRKPAEATPKKAMGGTEITANAAKGGPCGKDKKGATANAKDKKQDPCAKDKKDAKGGEKKDPCAKGAKDKKPDPCAKDKKGGEKKDANAKKQDPCAKLKKDAKGGEKKDPCAKGAKDKKPDPCAKDKKGGNKKDANAKKDPCAKFQKNANKGGEKKDPCAKDKKAAKGGEKKDPCAKDKKDAKGGEKKDPCAKNKKAAKGGDKKDPCAKNKAAKGGEKKDPCAKDKKAAKGGEKKDPCAKDKKAAKGGEKKKDPCAKIRKAASKGNKDGDGKKDPCKKKYSSFASPLSKYYHSNGSQFYNPRNSKRYMSSEKLGTNFLLKLRPIKTKSSSPRDYHSIRRPAKFTIYSSLIRRRYSDKPSTAQLADSKILRRYSKKSKENSKCAALENKKKLKNRKHKKARESLRTDCFKDDECIKPFCTGKCDEVKFPLKKCDKSPKKAKTEFRKKPKKELPPICMINKKRSDKNDKGERNKLRTTGSSTANQFRMYCNAAFQEHSIEEDSEYNKTIETIRIPAPYQICRERQSLPEVKPFDVLIRTGSIALTGSDVHVFENADNDLEGMTLGHDATGFVEELGKCVKHLRVGDRVVMESTLSCGICDNCKQGLYNICSDLVYNGFLATHQLHPADLCHLLPESLSMEEGALTQTLAMGCQACFKAHISPTTNVLIIGSSPTAVAAAMCATAIGARKVTIASTMLSSLQLIDRSFGFNTIYFDSNALFGEVLEKIYSKFHEWPNCAINCAISPISMNLVVMALQPSSACVLAECEMECASFNALDVLMKNIRLIPSFRSANMYPTAIQLMKSGRAPMHKLIAKTYTWPLLEEAFKSAQHESNVGLRKIIVNNAEEGAVQKINKD